MQAFLYYLWKEFLMLMNSDFWSKCILSKIDPIFVRSVLLYFIKFPLNLVTFKQWIYLSNFVHPKLICTPLSKLSYLVCTLFVFYLYFICTLFVLYLYFKNKISRDIQGVIHKLRWQFFGFFWPPTPLRWHFLTDKS